MASPTRAAGDLKRQLTAEHVTARALVGADSIDEAAPRILRAIGESFGWEYAALWTVDHEAGALRCVDVWTVPSAELPAFDAACRGATFARGEGLPGRVWASGEPAWIPDIALDDNFPRKAIAERERLRSAFGFPILLRGEVLSVMEFFSREIREPDESLLSMLTTVGSQIGMFIDRERAREQLERFFALSLDLLCVAGFDGYFKRVNPAWQQVLGYSEAELLGRPYMEFVLPEDRQRTIDAASALSQGKEVVHFENRYLHKDGTHRWLLWMAAPFPERQTVFAAARDITERKADEEALARYARILEAARRDLEDQAARQARLMKELEIAKRRAEAATETKSTFLANMSHEIRTPLSVILGMTSLVLDTRLTDRQREQLATVKASAESLLEIVNDVLDFSKIEAQRLDLDRTVFDLRDVVGDTAKLLALRAEEKGLELALDIAADVPDKVIGDPGRLGQVLLNLIGNAVKFTSTGEVVVRVAQVSSAADDVTLEFRISDTGIGIPADKQEQIFQAFTQADASTTRRYGGTGLGLAIVQRLVELMGGRIGVDSEAGAGSTFHFTAVFGRVKADAPEEPGPVLDGLRVLVVDDNATNRQILAQMLASWRMVPTVVDDAQGAMTALREARAGERYDAVIADAQMPGVNGVALAARIQKDEGLRGTPVILLTSVGRPVSGASGVHASLAKPVKHSDLFDALAGAVHGSARRAGPAASLARRPPARKLRVLVAEDHAVNRKLLTTVLRKRGHDVVEAENGSAAVETLAASRAGFDVVVMDLQMPEMGGLEATCVIREREALEKRERVPIVALTAHALPGDRDRCLAAGMDGYLSKPIDSEQLIAVVEERAGAAPPRRTEARPSTDEVFDEQAALAHAGGDRALLAEVVSLFRADCPTRVDALERALAQRDGEAARMTAHALKGAIAVVGAPAVRDVAAALEDAARAERFEDADRIFADLRERLARLDAAFVDCRLVGRKPRRAPGRAPRRTSHRKRSRS